MMMCNPNQENDPVTQMKDSSDESILEGETGDDTVSPHVVAVQEGKYNLPFPANLHAMLEQTERNGEDDIVAFLPHGKGFAIHKPKEFTRDVMPRFFRSRRFDSFRRQLLLYGFKRFSEAGTQTFGYHHEMFVKGQRRLSMGMVRKSQQARQTKRTFPDKVRATQQLQIATNNSDGEVVFLGESFASPAVSVTTMLEHQSATAQARTRTVLRQLNASNMLNKGPTSNTLRNRVEGPHSPSLANSMHPIEINQDRAPTNKLTLAKYLRSVRQAGGAPALTIPVQVTNQQQSPPERASTPQLLCETRSLLERANRVCLTSGLDPATARNSRPDLGKRHLRMCPMAPADLRYQPTTASTVLPKSYQAYFGAIRRRDHAQQTLMEEAMKYKANLTDQLQYKEQQLEILTDKIARLQKRDVPLLRLR